MSGPGATILRTDAIALQVFPVTETSRVATWLTREHGKLSTLIKGSQRPRSAFLGQYDLFYTCELLYYPRPRSGLHIARECSPLKGRERLRRDWRACAVASYLCGLVARSTLTDAPQRRLYEALDATLDYLGAEGADAGTPVWFELRLLELHGLSPRLRTCAGCGIPLAALAAEIRFSESKGGALCPACARAEAGATSPVAKDAVAVLAAWQEARDPAAAAITRVTARQYTVATRTVGAFLRYHLDTELIGREMALAMIRPRKTT